MAEGQVLYMRKDVDAKLDEDGSSTTAEDDIWDDTALVQAYDRAVSLAKEEVTRRMGLGKGSASGNESSASNKRRRRKRRSKKELQWHVGDPCRAVYSEDGMSYEATVDSICQEKGTCVVTFVGYKNVEEVPMKILEPSYGPSWRHSQQLAAGEEEEEVVENSQEMEVSDGDSVKEAAYFQPRSTSAQAKSRSGRLPQSRFVPSNLRSHRMPSMAVPPMVIPPPPPPHLTNSFPEEDAEALSAMLMSWYMSGFHTGYYQGLKQAKTLASIGGDMSRNSSRKK